MSEITVVFDDYTADATDHDTQERSEFDVNADYLAAYIKSLAPKLQAFVPEANGLRDFVELNRDEAVDARDVSLAGANYVGEWGDQTGAATPPLSVSHERNFWALKTTLADITTSQPSSTNADWEVIRVASYGGGAELIEISEDLQLGIGSSKKLGISATLDNLVVRLPMATDVDQDGQLFIIANTGSKTIYVKDIDNHTMGADLGAIALNKARAFFLLDQSLGQWLVLDVADSSIAGRLGESGLIIDPNTAWVFESAATSDISVTTLSDTKALVTYRDVINSDYGTACVLDVSGSTITPGTPVVFESANTYETSVTTLSDTKALVTYRDGVNSDYGTACVLDVSGSTITPGTPVVFESANTYDISVTTLSDTKALVTYRDIGNSAYGTACVLDVSGSTITPGTPVVFESATTYYISVTALSDTKALVTYRDDGNSSYGTACVLDVSGSTITPGTPVVFESAGTYYISVTALSDTKALVTYRDVGNIGYGTACVLDVLGASVTVGDPVIFESVGIIYISVTALSDTKALVTYRNLGNSDYGTAQILERR